MRRSRARYRARNLYADQLAMLGPAWSNLAQLVRSGWENMWVRSAIDAMEALVLLAGDAVEDDDSEEEGRTSPED